MAVCFFGIAAAVEFRGAVIFLGIEHARARRLAIPVHRGGVRTCVQQNFHAFGVSPFRCQMQGCFARFVPGIEVGILLRDQLLQPCGIPLLHSFVQRSGRRRGDREQQLKLSGHPRQRKAAQSEQKQCSEFHFFLCSTLIFQC